MKFTAGITFKVLSWYSENEQPEFLPIWGIRHYILDCIRHARKSTLLVMPRQMLTSFRHDSMGESSNFPKSWTFETPVLKLAVCPLNIYNFKLNDQLSLDRPNMNQRTYYNLSNSAFWGWLSMESQPQDPEFRNDPENFHPCDSYSRFYF